VGIASAPARVVVLVDGPVPDTLPDLHPALKTRGVNVQEAREISHGSIVPVMLDTAIDPPSQVRPGAWLIEPFACTLAHVVEDAQGGLYALTAGHCVDTDQPRSEDVGARTTIVTDSGPMSEERLTFGTVLAFENRGLGDDWALIAVDEALEQRVESSMAGWQGPTGLAADGAPGTVHHYGFGSAATWTTDATRCRAGSTLGFWGAKSFGFESVILYGDSGSPSQSATGEAIGINTHLVGNLGLAGGTLATEAIDEARQATGLDLSLVNGSPQRAVCQVGQAPAG